MTTLDPVARELSELTAQPISRSTLLELLSSQGADYENLGAGVQASLLCLQEAQSFYDLPAQLAGPLERFAESLLKATAALAEARELIG